MSPNETTFIHLQTFQSEDAIAQGIHDVVERSFIRHIEEVFVVRIAGDELNLRDERLRVLLPADIMTKNLEPSVGEKIEGFILREYGKSMSSSIKALMDKAGCRERREQARKLESINRLFGTAEGNYFSMFH